MSELICFAHLLVVDSRLFDLAQRKRDENVAITEADLDEIRALLSKAFGAIQPAAYAQMGNKALTRNAP
ncbi:MAG: hypothetical protein WDM86_11030 [Rhizomicrobium sp.]